MLGQHSAPAGDSLWKRIYQLLTEPSNEDASNYTNLLADYQSKVSNNYAGHDSAYALLLYKLGRSYADHLDYTKGIALVKNAIQVVRKGSSKTPAMEKQLVEYYHRLYDFYARIGQYNEAKLFRDSCIAIARRLHVINVFYLWELQQRVDFLFSIGDFARCSEEALTGEAAAHEINELDKSYVFAHRRINAEQSLGNYQKAEKILADVLTWDTSVINKNKGNIYEQLGLNEVIKGNYKKAIEYYDISFSNHRKYKSNKGCTQALENLAFYVYASHFRDGNKALQYYRKALQYAVKVKLEETPGDKPELEVLNLYTNMANAFLLNNRFDSAFAYFNLAFGQVRPGFTIKDIWSLPVDVYVNLERVWYLTASIVDYGNAHLKKFELQGSGGDLTEAINIYKIADRLLARIRLEQDDLNSKLSWIKDSKRLYENAIKAAYLNNNTADAFYFFEGSRAVLLSDQLIGQNLLGKEDIFKLAQSRSAVNQLKAWLDNNPSTDADYKNVQHTYEQNKIELSNIEALIKIRNPLYYQRYLDTSFISMTQVKKELLHGRDALIEFYNGDSAVYSLIITNRQVYCSRINKQAFDSSSHAYMAYLSNADKMNTDFPGFINTSQKLYRLIFQQVSLPKGRIVISPGGMYFPFEALVTAYRNNQPVYFLEDHITSYTYSVRYLLTKFNISSPGAGENFLGVAPVYFPASTGLPSLGGSNNSLDKIRTYFSGAYSLVTSQATRNNFQRNFSRYAIIQLYTHASEQSEKDEPRINFSDSALYLSELVTDRRPMTRLIVLSACETGSGQLHEGEGVFSFNRGFAGLGIPSSVANLWSVDNDATYRVTELFYKYLSAGLPLDEALQHAKLDYLSSARGENKLPFYWAAPILVGRTDAITFNRHAVWKEWLLGIAILLLSVIIILSVRKRYRKPGVILTAATQ